MHGLYFQAVFVESMGLPKEVLFLSLLFLLHFFFVEVLAAIIYEQGGNKREKIWLWRWATARKTGTGRKHFLLVTPKLDRQHIYEPRYIKR